MKTIFTFLSLLLCMTIMAQNGVVHVDVENVCGDAFDKPITIELYKVDGANQTYVSTSTSNPATFSGLEEGFDYLAVVTSSDHVDATIDLRDMHYLRGMILGIDSFFIPAIIAADLNNSNGASTLDLVLMGRDIVGLVDQNLSDWFFMEENADFSQSQDYSDFFNQALLQDVSSDPSYLTFIAYHDGEVADALGKKCTACQIDPNSTFNAILPYDELEVGQSIDFPIYVRKEMMDIGCSFSLKYSDASNISVTSDNGTYIKLNEVDHTINFLNYFYDTSDNPFFKIANVSMTAQRAGSISSFFALNPDYNNEAIYEGVDCVMTYGSVSVGEIGECPIYWPPSEVTIPDCIDAYHTGAPSVDTACVGFVYFAYQDQSIGGPNGCQKIIRTWTGLNWLTGEIYHYVQVIKINSDYPTICIDFTVDVSQGATIHARDVIVASQDGHVYSFSDSSPADSTRYFTYISPYVVDLIVYDLTDTTFCIGRMTKYSCTGNEPVNIINTVTVSAASGFYTVEASLFDGGNANNCLGEITNFEFRSQPAGEFTSSKVFDYSQYSGTEVLFDLRYQIDGLWTDGGEVKVKFSSTNVFPPFELSCFDDPIIKNEPIEITIHSANFDNLYAFQGALRVDDALIVSTRKIALNDIVFNQQLHSLGFVWLLPTAQPFTLTQQDTLFAFTILPTKSGKVSDILSIADDIILSEAVINDFTQTKISLKFNFMQRTVGTKEEVISNTTNIYPNPNGTGLLNVEANLDTQTKVNVCDGNGRICYNGTIAPSLGIHQIQLPDDLANGVYHVTLSNEKMYVVKKIILLR